MDFPIKNGENHSYVSLPEGTNHQYHHVFSMFTTLSSPCYVHFAHPASDNHLVDQATLRPTEDVIHEVMKNKGWVSGLVPLLVKVYPLVNVYSWRTGKSPSV